jgi:hypothetical protein
MPDLAKSLLGRDLGYYRIVADLWGVDWDAPDARLGLQRLLPLLLKAQSVGDVVGNLPINAREALNDLASSEHNRLSWSLFTRRYGVVREMGPARRDRDQPFRSPISPAEILWYRALVGRAFFDTPAGPEEFAFIPDDLLELMPPLIPPAVSALGREATPVERSFIQPANDRILDHATTLLAALRLGLDKDKLHDLASAWRQPGRVSLSTPALQSLLNAAGLLDAMQVPYPDPSRQFLEAGRAEALASLYRAWVNSAVINDLRLMPGIKAEGEWQNDPLRTRQAVLDFLATIPGTSERPFWSLAAFVQAVRDHYPDFQRLAGDYDSWYVRDETSGEYLRGFEHWDQVDGALLRYFIAGPLHWLGIFDLAWSSDPEQDPGARLTAFRYSQWAAKLLHGQAPEGLAEENLSIQVRSDARLVVPRLAPRPARYQIARFCQWEAEKSDEYLYRLTPGSLARARSQGLKPNHLLALLQRYAKTVAPALVKAIERWERLGVEARLEQVLVLRLSTPEVMQTVRLSKASRFLGEPLGPTAVIVQQGALEKVLAILAELGYLGEVVQ